MKMMQSFLFAIVFTAVLAAEQIPSSPPLSARGLNEALVGVAKKVIPAVAMVTTEGYRQVAYNPPGVTSFGLRLAGGSGVIVSADGYIVTNAHVVAGATRIHVQLSSNGAPAGPALSLNDRRSGHSHYSISRISRRTPTLMVTERKTTR